MSPDAFVTGTRVLYRTRDGRQAPGTLVGPDQNYFPSPAEVFVSFPASGFTRLLPVSDLTVLGAARQFELTETDADVVNGG